MDAFGQTTFMNPSPPPRRRRQLGSPQRGFSMSPLPSQSASPMAAFSPHSAAWFPTHSSPHVHMQGMPDPHITYPVHYAFKPPPFNNQQVYPAPSVRFLQERPVPQVVPDQWPMATLHTTDQLPSSPQPDAKQKKRRRNRNQRSESAGQLIPEQDDDGSSSNAASVIPKRPRNARNSSQSTRWAVESQSSEPYEEPLPPKRTPKSCFLFPLALLAVVVIVVIFGSAGKVFKVISEEFPPGGAIANRRGLPTPEKPILRPQPASTRRTECSSESCQWQSRYLHHKLNHSVSPCKDFYSHVCSNEWFQNADDSLKPYAYSASTSTMLGLWDILKQHPADSKTTTFVNEASQFMRRCVPGSKKDTDWKVFRRMLSDFGIDEWPYGDSVPDSGAHNIAAKAEKMLGFSTLVSMSLRERPTTHEIMLHVNSPPILLRLYKDAYPGKDIKAYGEFVFEVLSLWNPGGHDILPSVLALMDLEERISIAASHSSRSVPVLHVTLPIAAIRSYPHWNWQSYFQHFLDGNLAQHSNSNIALLDPVYFNHLTSILSRATTRTLLNYVGYKLVVFLSPLLPSNKADFMVPLSYHHHLATGVSTRRLEACMFLLERLYPIPTRALVWSHLLKKAPSLSSGDIADELQNMEHLARNEMKQAATHTSWLTQEEASVAVLKIERMKLILAPNNREDTFRQLHVASRISDDASFIEAAYNSQRNLREKYWRGDNLSLFHEPVTATDSAFVPGFVYEPDRNELTVSPVTVDFIVGISRHPDATSVPFFLGEVLRGMFSAMSIRGSTIDADGDLRHWWTSTTEDRFVERAKCLQNSFADETRLYIQEELRDKFVFMEENVQDGAVLRPLYNIHRWLTKNSGKSGPIPGQPKGLGPSKLFFINWASTFCEPEQPQEVARDRLHFKISVPPRTRLNVALSRFPPFSATFRCPVGSEMNPTKACSFW